MSSRMRVEAANNQPKSSFHTKLPQEVQNSIIRWLPVSDCVLNVQNVCKAWKGAFTAHKWMHARSHFELVGKKPEIVTWILKSPSNFPTITSLKLYGFPWNHAQTQKDNLASKFTNLESLECYIPDVLDRFVRACPKLTTITCHTDLEQSQSLVRACSKLTSLSPHSFVHTEQDARSWLSISQLKTITLRRFSLRSETPTVALMGKHPCLERASLGSMLISSEGFSKLFPQTLKHLMMTQVQFTFEGSTRLSWSSSLSLHPALTILELDEMSLSYKDFQNICIIPHLKELRMTEVKIEQIPEGANWLLELDKISQLETLGLYLTLDNQTHPFSETLLMLKLPCLRKFSLFIPIEIDVEGDEGDEGDEVEDLDNLAPGEIRAFLQNHPKLEFFRLNIGTGHMAPTHAIPQSFFELQEEFSESRPGLKFFLGNEEINAF